MLLNTYHGSAEVDLQMQDVRLNLTGYAPDAAVPVHEHGNAYVCIAVAGEFREWEGRRERKVRAHDLVYHPPGHRHADCFSAAGGRCLNMEIEPAWFERMQIFGSPRAVYASDPELRRLGRSLMREWQGGGLRKDSFGVDELLLTLLRKLRGPVRRRGDRTPAWLLAVRDRLHADFMHNHRLDELAAVEGVHPVHLAREFRRQFGCPPGEYLRNLRVQYACKLLSGPAMPMVEVALAAGFASQSHLCRVFAAHTGMSPGVWRQKTLRT